MNTGKLNWKKPFGVVQKWGFYMPDSWGSITIGALAAFRDRNAESRVLMPAPRGDGERPGRGGPPPSGDQGGKQKE